jgi:hypothetical protein
MKRSECVKDHFTQKLLLKAVLPLFCMGVILVTRHELAQLKRQYTCCWHNEDTRGLIFNPACNPLTICCFHPNLAKREVSVTQTSSAIAETTSHTTEVLWSWVSEFVSVPSILKSRLAIQSNTNLGS